MDVRLMCHRFADLLVLFIDIRYVSFYRGSACHRRETQIHFCVLSRSRPLKLDHSQRHSGTPVLLNATTHTLRKAKGKPGPGYRSRYSDWLRAGRFGVRIPLEGEIFRTCPDRPWGPLSLLYNWYRIFPGGKAAGAWRWPPTLSIVEVKKRIELYLNSTSGTSRLVIR